jgi:hypothetical protein
VQPTDTPLVKLTESLLQQRDDVKEVYHLPNLPKKRRRGTRLEFTGGPDFFADDCIYDPVDDGTARWLLEDFIGKKPEIGWSVGSELSKLLSKRGHLVHDSVMPIILSLAEARLDSEGILTVSFAPHQLCLSYICLIPDGEALALRLLDVVTEDCRDGLFLACFKMNTPAIYEKVKAKVREWVADEESPWGGSSTGEQWLIRKMVQKWDITFPNGDHEDIRRIGDGEY